MKKIITISLFIAATFTLNSCSKLDWLRDLHNDPGNSDYVSASADSIMWLTEDIYLPFLFKKIYADKGDRLGRIVLTYRTFALPGVPAYDTLVAKRSFNHLIFLRSPDDTVVDITLNAFGKPLKAIASLTMGLYESEPKATFSFYYSGGKLSRIYSKDSYLGEGDYIKLDYEPGKNNIKNLYYGPGSGDKVTYSYDYSVKALAQYYPDEMRGQAYHFWDFLRYINLFGELQNENLLKMSYHFNTDYPGDVSKIYTQHKLDSKGRLISFYLSEQLVSSSFVSYKASWTIAWR